jgi:hypothetical protein
MGSMLFRGLVTVAIGLLSLFCLKLYKARSFFKQLEKQGLVGAS